MKKIIIGIVIVIILIVLVACGNRSSSDAVSALAKEVNDLDSYKVTATMKITRNGKVANYDLEILYKKPDNYKVKLLNRESENIQLILKNNEGVYLLTPTLNKSFKFQSDWPLNSSNAFLLQSIVKDAINDENPSIKKEEGNIVIETTVNSSIDSTLAKQKITIDGKTKLPKSVVVYDNQGNPKIEVDFHEFEKNLDINDEEFTVDYSLQMSVLELGDGYNNEQSVLKYPSYFPTGAFLADELVEDDGIIMTFSGAYNYTIVQEILDNTSSVSSQTLYGDPVVLTGGVGAITTNWLTILNENVECTVYSDELSQNELMDIGDSIYDGIPEMREK